MTIQPIPQPISEPQLLTIDEYLEIGEIEFGYSELVEGRLMMSPSPKPRHSRAESKLWHAVDSQSPDGFEALQDLDVNLELASPGGPGFSRRPDLIVAQCEARERVEREGGMIRASEVALVVEIVSPGSVRTDNVIKRADYADAGIPHYWIVDITEPVSLIACHLAGEFGYADSGAVTGRFTTTAPFPVKIDLDALLD